MGDKFIFVEQQQQHKKQQQQKTRRFTAAWNGVCVCV